MKDKAGARPGHGAALAVSVLLAIMTAVSVAAQDGVSQSRAVVQPIPPPEAEELNRALRRLATDPQDVSALIDAGRASLALGDINAAAGFYSRAAALAPGDPRAKAGLGAAYVRNENPYEALLMFEEAERAGASGGTLAADRGLALDLVGDNAHAQEFYRKALARGPDDEITRRLALSLAISGDGPGTEATLLPLLQKRDHAAYRTRAFALAILGETKEALSIVEAVMPKDMARQISPYIRYMPKLTPAQQAAAVNFGHFPRASDIGRDDPRVVEYGAAAKQVYGVDSGLIPAGPPLGGAQVAGKGKPSVNKDREREEKKASKGNRREDPKLATIDDVRARAGGDLPLPPSSAPAPRPPSPSLNSGVAMAAPGPAAVPVARIERIPATVALPAPQPVLPVPPEGQVAAPAPEPAYGEAVRAKPSPPPTSVAEAFADLAPPSGDRKLAAGAVDITRITPRRERPPEPEEKPPVPAHPSRHWVQVATGRDSAALAFDWRRIGRAAPDLFAGRKGYLASWGQTNRLLAGPFESPAQAAAFVTALKKAQIDSFTFTSAKGEQVMPLGGGG